MRGRVTIEGIKPEIDFGRFAIKRTVGERVTVEADIFCDGHDALTAVLCSRNYVELDPAQGTGTHLPGTPPGAH